MAPEPIGLVEIEDGAEVSLQEAAALLSKCEHTHPEEVVKVWEPASRFYSEQGTTPYAGAIWPNRVGCKSCGKFIRIVT